MNKQNTVGVVICRVQVHRIHDGHRYLFERAIESCEKLLVILGVSGGWASKNDPLDFETRRVMVNALYPNAVVVPMLDHPSNEAWSAGIDNMIEANFPNHRATLFGSRESFLPFYGGKHQKKYVAPKESVPSGTDLRLKVGGVVRDSEDFRAGVIYAGTSQNFPTSFQAVDVAIRHSTERKVIVGRKAGETSWRFPGGFVDPKDTSLEMAAKREAVEEVGSIEIDGVKYIGSMRINDYRYRKSEHKVMTALFSAVYIFGRVHAGDDLVEARWQDFDGLIECLVDDHKTLGNMFLKSLS